MELISNIKKAFLTCGGIHGHCTMYKVPSPNLGTWYLVHLVHCDGWYNDITAFF
jgi:hypothetical protein